MKLTALNGFDWSRCRTIDILIQNSKSTRPSSKLQSTISDVTIIGQRVNSRESRRKVVEIARRALVYRSISCGKQTSRETFRLRRFSHFRLRKAYANNGIIHIRKCCFTQIGWKSKQRIGVWQSFSFSEMLKSLPSYRSEREFLVKTFDCTSSASHWLPTTTVSSEVATVLVYSSANRASNETTARRTNCLIRLG